MKQCEDIRQNTHFMEVRDKYDNILVKALLKFGKWESDGVREYLNGSSSHGKIDQSGRAAYAVLTAIDGREIYRMSVGETKEHGLVVESIDLIRGYPFCVSSFRLSHPWRGYSR